jgi:hypothetical protein
MALAIKGKDSYQPGGKNVIAVGFNQRIEYIAARVAEERNYHCRWFQPTDRVFLNKKGFSQNSPPCHMLESGFI